VHLRLDDIAVLETGRPPGADRIRRKGAVIVAGMPRRSFLQAMWVTGMGIGLAALGVFPLARKALAHDGHLIYPESRSNGPCARDGYATNNDCSPGCSRIPCVNCCIEDGFLDEGYVDESDEFTDEPADFTGYHRHEYSSDGVEYSWRPNQCWGGTYDGWLWRCSPEILYRCHDGYVTTEDGTILTVCRWEV
jgi:hypothetical protein